MPSTGARGYRVSRGLAPSGVQGQSPWSGGLGNEVPQKQTIFNSVKCSFLMNNNITFSFIIQSQSVKLGKNTKLTNIKHKKQHQNCLQKWLKSSPSCRKLLNRIQILIIILYCISWYI